MIMKKASWAGLKALAGRIQPAGCSLETPELIGRVVARKKKLIKKYRPIEARK